MKNEKILTWTAIFLIPIALFLLSPMWMSIFKDFKNIEYAVLSESTITGLGMELDDWPEIKILYKDEELNDAGFIKIKIENNGTLPITKEDFQKPISIEFNKESVVLGYRKVSSYPEELTIEGNIEAYTLTIEPLLLNPDDSITLEIFVKGKIKLESLSGRVTGVNSIKEAVRVNREGLYIELIVEDTHIGISRHARIFKLNTLSLFLVATILLTASFVSKSFRMFNLKPSDDVIDKILGFLIYLSGLYVSMLYTISASELDNRYLDSLNFLSPICLSILITYLIKRAYEKKISQVSSR